MAFQVDSDENGSDTDFENLAIARSAYGDMLHDTERNAYYESGIKWAIGEMRARGVQNIVVLDIGTGSGLLSMLAARHGADTIYACDSFEPVVEVARKVITANGFGDRVKLIPKASCNVTVGEDMETKAHILVTELFDTELIGEGALLTYKDAYSRLLHSDCIMVPQDATIYVQVVNSKFLRRHHTLNTFGLGVTERIKKCSGIASVHDIQLSQLEPSVELDLVTEPMEAFFFDFKALPKVPAQRSLELPDDKELSDVCVLMWWKTTMCPGLVLSCAPFWAHPDGKSQAWRDHWMQSVYYPSRTKGKYLSCCGDEFSFWLDLTDEPGISIEMPVCSCGLHFTTPRARLALIGDCSYVESLTEVLKQVPENNILLLGEKTFSLPLVLALNIPDKKFQMLDMSTEASDTLQELFEINKLDNFQVYDGSKDVQLVFAEPYSSKCLLPWDYWFELESFLDKEEHLKSLNRLPSKLHIMYMSVDLQDLWKIRAPIKSTLGLNMAAYDDFIQTASASCDKDVEPQPLWEYPCIALSLPQELVSNPKKGQTVTLKPSITSNGIALWAEYDFGSVTISNGPSRQPEINKKVEWNRYVKQGIIINVYEKREFAITF